MDEGKVIGDGQMRKEGGLLWRIGHRPKVRWHMKVVAIEFDTLQIAINETTSPARLRAGRGDAGTWK